MQEPNKKFSKTTKNYLLIGAIIIIVIILMASISNTISNYESDISYYKTLVEDYKEKNEKLNEKVEEAEPWFNMDEKEQQEIIDKQEAEQQEKERKELEQQEKEELEQSRVGTTPVDVVNPETGKSQTIYLNNDTLEYMENIYETECPYCGGTYIIDCNDNSEYCEDCGYSSYDNE